MGRYRRKSPFGPPPRVTGPTAPVRWSSPPGCASTPRWRRSTTATAASCSTCCASWPANGQLAGRSGGLDDPEGLGQTAVGEAGGAGDPGGPLPEELFDVHVAVELAAVAVEG